MGFTQEEKDTVKAAKEAEANTPVTLIVEITPKRWAIVREAAMDGLREWDENPADGVRDTIDEIDGALKTAEPVRKIQLPAPDAEVQ